MSIDKNNAETNKGRTPNRTLLDGIEDEISEEDEAALNKNLGKTDRVGIGGHLLVSLIGFALGIVVGIIIFIGVRKLGLMSIPLIGGIFSKLFGPGIFAYCMIAICGIIGGYLAHIFARLVRSGARQDERNKQKRESMFN